MTKILVATREHSSIVNPNDSFLQAFCKFNADRRSVDFVADPEIADVIVVFEEWGARFADYAMNLIEDDFVRRNLHKIFTVNYDSVGLGHLPGCYVSLQLRNFDLRYHRTCAYPYTYNEVLATLPKSIRNDAPTYLFSFEGTDTSHPIRRKIAKCLSTSESYIRIERTGFHQHTESQKRAYAEKIQNSRFVLCPRGGGPSSYRLFEVMELGRCPVIISDDWLQIENVRWDTCSVRVAESDIEQIPRILNELLPRATELGIKARSVWEENFAPGPKYRSMLDSILELWGGARSNDWDHMKRWKSRKFRKNNKWTLPQRIEGRLNKIFRKLTG